MSKYFTALAWAGGLLMALLLTLSAPTLAAAADDPFNRVEVIVDASGSFRSRQTEAIAKVGELLQGLSLRKTKRWDQADQIEIISLDAVPEVVWKGTPKDLAAVNRAEWVRRFQGRRDYANCTDVTAALRLATARLETTPAPTDAYIYIFSDLIDEPPTQGVSTCAPPRSVVGADFDWASLKSTRIAGFWLPVSQKLAWSRAMTAHGLTAFRLMSNSESGVNSVDIPPPAERVITEAERHDTVRRAGGFLKLIGLGAAGLAVFTVLGGMAVALVARRRPRPPIHLSAPRSGQVPPMRVPRKS